MLPSVKLRQIHMVAGGTALIGSVIFFLPLLGAFQPTSSGWPGFMMSGDVQKFYLPSYVEGYRRFWNGGLLGIDFLTLDGASVFAFRANLMPFYPPYLISYLIFDISNVKTAVWSYCAIHILHALAALYCCVMLGRRFLRLNTAASVLFAVAFCLSYQASSYIAFATFYFQMMLVPVLAYALCNLFLARSWRTAVLLSPLFLTHLLSSYGPTMGAALLTAMVLAGYVFLTRIRPLRNRTAWRSLIGPAVSLGIGCCVALPYYLAQLRYVDEVAPSHLTVQSVALDLAFSGRDLVNGFSQALRVGSSVTEGRLIWGMIPAVLVLLGFLVVILQRDKLPRSQVHLLHASTALYLVYLAISLGQSLASSEMFYYAVPFLGKMHIFQRYLLFGQIFLAAAVASGAALFLSAATPQLRAVVATVALIVWLGLSIRLNMEPPLPTLVDLGPFLAELFICFVAVIAICSARSQSVMIAAAIMSAVVSVQTMYSMQAVLGRPVIWTSELEPTGADNARLVAFFKQHSTKELSKILHLSASPGPFLYRNYPWLIGSQIKIMAYHGYEPHLSMMRGYWALMGGFYGEFNRDWVLRSGLDFLMWDKTAASQIANLQGHFGSTVKLGPTLSLGDNLTVAKIIRTDAATADAPEPLLELTERNAPKWPAITLSDGWEIAGGRLRRTNGQSNNFTVPVRPTPGARYKLSFNATGGGGFIATVLGGSGGTPVAIPGSGRYSVTLEPATHGNLWVGTAGDFKGELSDITLTEIPRSPQKPLPIALDTGVMRLQAPENTVTVHRSRTDFAKRVVLEATVGSEARLTYLLWPIPYMVPYLDGKRVTWQQEPGRPAWIALPQGRHVFELRFESRLGTAFLTACWLYGLVMAATLFWPLTRRLRRRT